MKKSSLGFFILVTNLLNGCAFYSEKPAKFDFARSKCQSPISVDATVIEYPDMGKFEKDTVKVSRPVTIDAKTDPLISKENPKDESIVRILKRTSELTGCRFSLTPSNKAEKKIALIYTTNATQRKLGIWFYLSAATLGVIPTKYSVQNTLAVEIETGSMKKQFTYIHDSTNYMGIIFLPLMAFDDPRSYRVDYFASMLANDFCQVSGDCN